MAVQPLRSDGYSDNMTVIIYRRAGDGSLG